MPFLSATGIATDSKPEAPVMPCPLCPRRGVADLRDVQRHLRGVEIMPLKRRLQHLRF